MIGTEVAGMEKVLGGQTSGEVVNKTVGENIAEGEIFSSIKLHKFR